MSTSATSTSSKDGGPAFPQAFTLKGDEESRFGMSLRDYFAGQALAGLSCAEQPISIGGERLTISVAAYKIADWMLKERAK